MIIFKCFRLFGFSFKPENGEKRYLKIFKKVFRLSVKEKGRPESPVSPLWKQGSSAYQALRLVACCAWNAGLLMSAWTG